MRLRPLLLAALALLLSVAVAVGAQQTGEITQMEHELDAPIEDIQWADLQNVFILTRAGTLYHSNNGGHTLHNQMEQLPEGIHFVTGMYISPRDPHKVFFTGKQKANFHTLDMGRSYHACPQIEIMDVRLHPAMQEWILASTMAPGCQQKQEGPVSGEECYKILWVSKDFGLTWTAILNYVVQFDWAHVIGDLNAASRVTDPLIYVTAHESQQGNQRFGVWDRNIHFYGSNDFFKTQQKLVAHGNRFLFGDHSYLFVAAVDPQDETQVSLKISRDNVTHLQFHTAMLPGNIHLTEHSYTILDTSEGSVFLHVNHLPFQANAYAGHVYTSDWTGLQYSLSLPYNHRNLEGKCDFEKVEGLEGIYLSNFIDEEMMEDEEQAEQLGAEGRHGAGRRVVRRTKHVDKRERLRTKTVITFDKGAEWSYLVPPSHDSLGLPIQCAGECHLHLHGVTDAFGPFYSTASALGLIMGTGVVGAYLQQHPDQVNTFFSRDAGLTWFEVAKGSHIYEYGNHGALIAMAPDNHHTDSLLYSYDEGTTWVSHRIAHAPFQVENIIIEPAANARQFVVYGHRDDVGVLIHVDLEPVHERDCVGHENPDDPASDYEKWTPADRRLNGKCLLGRTVTYVRRKRAARCDVPEAFQRPIDAQNCACTAADFECDYGYERQKIDFDNSPTFEQGPCVPMAHTPHHANPLDPPPCTTSQTYRVTKGYRRVPGDSCIGGAEWDAAEAPCPWTKGNHVGKIVLVLLILVIVSYLLVTLASKLRPDHPVARFLSGLRSHVSAARYSVLGAKGGADVPHSMVDDGDAFYLSEDEFGPSAHLIDNEAGEARPRFSPSASSGGSGIKPLPAAKGKAHVPTIAPPS